MIINFKRALKATPDKEYVKTNVRMFIKLSPSVIRAPSYRSGSSPFSGSSSSGSSGGTQ